MSTPITCASRAIWPSVPTTPLTCGCQASVTIRIFMRSGCFGRRRQRHRRPAVVACVRPGDDLKSAVVAFGNRSAAFHPVAAIDVTQSVFVMHGSGVNMAADHTVRLMMPGLGCQRLFEGTDIIHRILDLEFRPFRQRPIRRTEHAAESIEDTIGGKGEFVGLVTEEREPT